MNVGCYSFHLLLNGWAEIRILLQISEGDTCWLTQLLHVFGLDVVLAT